MPDGLIADTLLELEQQFGTVSSETQFIHGRWQHEGRSYRDELVRVFVDVADSPVNVEFFENLKARLKTRFQQLEIWVTTYVIEVL